MLSKKDYEVIARSINNLDASAGLLDKDELVTSLSDYFEKDNLAFDRDRFFKACYRKEE